MKTESQIKEEYNALKYSLAGITSRLGRMEKQYWSYKVTLGEQYVKHGYLDVDVLLIHAANDLWDEIIATKAELEELEKKLPCVPLVEALGWVYHEKLKERYPINKDTLVVHWKGYPVKDINYYVPQDHIFTIDPMPILPFLHNDVKTCQMERYAYQNEWGGIREYCIGYAPEINTIYWY
jgi:hypothetical protein